MLAEEGKLHLDDAVGKHLPPLARYGPRMTIRHLLHHTSGIRDFYDEAGTEEVLRRYDRPTNDDVIRIYAELGCPMADPGIQPGDRFEYSNSGYDLLGAVIARASGASYHDFFQRRVFDRLGMKDTFSAPDRRVSDPRTATGYQSGNWGRFQHAGRIGLREPGGIGFVLHDDERSLRVRHGACDEQPRQRSQHARSVDQRPHE